MTSPAAERQRRYRLHHKGDHSRCLPERCSEAAADPVTVVTSRVMRHEQLGETGKALWFDVTKGGGLEPAQLALLVEACRIADRLDKLEAHLSGGDQEWLRVEPDYENPDRPVVVIVDKALAEARQQALALKGLLAEIRQASRAAAPAKPASAAAPAGNATATSVSGGGNVLSLAAGIAARRPNPAAG